MKSAVFEMNSSDFAIMENIITKEEPVDMYSSDLSDMKTITTEQQVEMYLSGSVVPDTIVANGHLVKTERIVKDEVIIEINSADLNMDTNTKEKQLVETYFSEPGDVKECIMEKANTRNILLEEIMKENSDNDIFPKIERYSDEIKTELIDITKIKIEDVDMEPYYIDVKRNVPLEETMEEISNYGNFCLESSKKEDCVQNYIKSEEIEIKTDVTVESDNDSGTDRFEGKPRKLKKHQVIPDENAAFKCFQCQKGFSRKQSLHYHINAKHSQLDHYQCNYCLQGFLRKDYLKQHISAIHLKLRPYVCKDCKKTFSRKYFLEGHIVSHHQNNLDLMKMVPGKIYNCDHCPFKCLQNNVMKNHLKTHGIRLSCHTKFKCPQCKKVFSSKQNIENHFLKKHDNLADIVSSKIHSCNICNFKTTLNSQLKHHISSVHLNLRPHICKGCKKTFIRKYSLDRHIISRHQRNLDLMKTVTNKIYNCDHCTFKSLQNEVMKSHLKTHSRHV